MTITDDLPGLISTHELFAIFSSPYPVNRLGVIEELSEQPRLIHQNHVAQVSLLLHGIHLQGPYSRKTPQSTWLHRELPSEHCALFFTTNLYEYSL